MPKRLLVPLDGSEQSWHALEYALEEFPEATIAALNVINPAESGYSASAGLPSYAEEWYENKEAQAEALFAEARERAGPDCDLETTTSVGTPASEIVAHVEEGDVDGVVMGSHGRSGVQRILLGSVAETVVRNSPVPVTVVR